MKKIIASFLFLSGACALIMLNGCEVQNVNGTTRLVDADVSGVYRNSASNENNGVFVSRNSGKPVNSMDLRQNGSDLAGIDNNNKVFRGSIGTVNENVVSFQLDGETTAGSAVKMSGSIEISSGKGVMRATWIEDSFYGTVYGVANGPTINTNTPSPSTDTSAVSISQKTATMTNNAPDLVLKASGGSGSYNWSVSEEAKGTVDQKTGSSVKYRRKSSGPNIVTVEDTETGDKDTCNITQP